MPNTRFGNFSELVKDKKPMTAKEAWIMLNELGLLTQEFVPGATSVRKLLEGEPREAIEELQDWIPGNAAYQNWLKGEDQDWVRNALDAMVIANPAVKGVSKAAKFIEKIPKGGKEGYVRFPMGYKDATKNKIANTVGLSTQKQRKLYSEYTKLVDASMSSGRSDKGKLKQLFNRMDKETKEAAEAYQAASTLRVARGYGAQTVVKPEGFDDWSGIEREKWFLDNLPEYEATLDRANQLMRDANAEGIGPLFKDVIQDADMRKASADAKLERALAAERAEAPITMTEVQDLSTGILPSEAGVSQGGTRATYDHSRPFMDTELKQVPGIDRTGMSYGENSDAFYDLYKAWRNNPGKEQKAINKVIREAKSRPSTNTIKQTDPYYNAGIVGDKNNRLWERINKLRAEGKSDTDIRALLKDELDEYQGDIERFKARMPSNNTSSQMTYDGASTNNFKAVPSEEARALKALGVDTPEYDELDRLGDFYRVFFPQ